MNMHDVEIRMEQMRRFLANAIDPARYSYDLGMKLLAGHFDKEGEIFAAEFLEKAALLGVTDAMYHLGLCYVWGNGGVYAEPEKAMVWMRMAAEQGNEKAADFTARFDTPDAISILALAAMNGKEGQGTLWYKTKLGTDMYYERAQAGDAECQYELARQLANPERIGAFKHNIDEAIHWYTKAAEQGVIDAMFNLSMIYKNGTLGAEINPTLAKAWMQKCADAGDAEAKLLVSDEEFWKTKAT